MTRTYFFQWSHVTRDVVYPTKKVMFVQTIVPLLLSLFKLRQVFVEYYEIFFTGDIIQCYGLLASDYPGRLQY